MYWDFLEDISIYSCLKEYQMVFELQKRKNIYRISIKTYSRDDEDAKQKSIKYLKKLSRGKWQLITSCWEYVRD